MNSFGTNIVIAGGKGLGMFSGAKVIKEWRPEDIANPYGIPSGKISLIEWEGAKIFCFSRHGDLQQLAPHDIPYLANAYAIKMLGVKYWVSVSLSTSLKGKQVLGDVVVPDDYISSNAHRKDQFFSLETISGLVLYIDNYLGTVSPNLKEALKTAAERADVALAVNLQANQRDIPPSDLIIFAGINGPHTGTWAEEKMLTTTFSNVVSGMTNMTEALVCAQAGISFAALNFIGGTGMNYGSIAGSLATYLTPTTGGIDAKIIPILKEFVKISLPAAPTRTMQEFLSMCTGGAPVLEAIQNPNAKHSVPPLLIDIVKVLAP